jgi:Nucleotidyltransferase domain
MPSSALSTLLARARDDDNVIGLVVHGSRGRGLYVTERSDLDVVMVVHELRDEYPSAHGDPVEVAEVTSLSRLPDWMLPALLWAEPALDKTGEVAEQLRAVTTVDPASAGEPLDGYVNCYYRSAKNARVGLELASLLDAQESIPWFLQFVFNVHGRIRPYNKWLEWELREHPLASCNVQLSQLEHIARTGDLTAQQALFRETEQLARERGHGDVIDGWEPDVAWLRSG